MTINYRPDVAKIPAWASQWLEGIMASVGVPSVTITETTRSPERQAAIMYNQCETRGVAAQRALYGSGGNKVIDVYATNKPLGMPRDALISMMALAITSIGPAKISKHIPTGNGHSVMDIAPSSIAENRRDAFLNALRAAQTRGEVGELIWPPKDLAFHVEAIPPEKRSVQQALNVVSDQSVEGDREGPSAVSMVIPAVVLVLWLWKPWRR